MTPAPTSFDPGLTQQYTGPLLRAINKDGSFNVRRRGLRGIAGSVYMHLVGLSWPRFWGLVALAYLAANIIFALLYTALGPGALRAAAPDMGLSAFSQAFFFSVHTLTTVGYGDLYPLGLGANVVASAEAALGLMGFALATGLLFARFSRPNAQLVFSDRMVVGPYRDGDSLQFRIANRRKNVLTDVLADMMLMTVEQDSGGQSPEPPRAVEGEDRQYALCRERRHAAPREVTPRRLGRVYAAARGRRRCCCSHHSIPHSQ